MRLVVVETSESSFSNFYLLIVQEQPQQAHT